MNSRISNIERQIMNDEVEQPMNCIHFYILHSAFGVGYSL